MPAQDDDALLDVLLNAWERNASIVVNLLDAVPENDLGARATEGGPTVAQLFSHIHSVRLAFVQENAPEIGAREPEVEWDDVRDRKVLAARLESSARSVRDAVVGRLESGKPLDRHFDHPILLFQMLTWHEGYHHGQIKLALKASGRALDDREIGRGTWGVWIRKTQTG